MKNKIIPWLTSSDRSALLKRQKSIPFNARENDYPIIRVDTSRVFQIMEGFGFSLTGGSAYLINMMSPFRRSALLREISSMISCLRLTIGASDLSHKSFTYDDMPAGQTDPKLAHFNIWAGDTDVIPVLKEILAFNPSVKIIASPWSAPPWMKNNNGFIGGSLKPKFYTVYAQYFIKYIRAMNEHGIPVHAITVQNEPLYGGNEPSMIMQPDEQAEFVKKHLGPAFRTEGIKTEIFCWDHNCDRPDYPFRIFMDKEASEFIAGSAWHLYGGQIDVLSSVHAVWPDKKIYFTEQWVGKNSDFGENLGWHAANVLIGSVRNWSQVVLEWNLASAPDFRPHTPKGGAECLGALTIDGNKVTRNVAYYLIGHISKFVPPGSVRISSTEENSLPNVAFLTPDGRIVLIVWNNSDIHQTFNIQNGNERAVAKIKKGTLATYVW